VTPASTAEPSDPFMLLIPDVKKYTRDATFHTSSVNQNNAVIDARNYLTVVSRSTSRDEITLDGTAIS